MTISASRPGRGRQRRCVLVLSAAVFLLAGCSATTPNGSTATSAVGPTVQVMIEAEGGDLRVVFDKCISPTSIAVIEGPNSEHGAGGVALLTPLVPSPGPIRSWSIGRPPLNYREEVLATALQKGDRVGVTVGWAGVQPTVESLGADVELAKGKRDGVVHGPLADGGTAVSGSVDGSVSVRC